MARVKRSRFLFFSIGDKTVVDAGAFLRGEIRVTEQSHLQALALLTGETAEVSASELGWLCQLPSRSWLAVEQALADSDLDSSRLREMALKGWLLWDAEDPDLASLCRKEELLRSRGWHPQAALYHFMDREDGATPVDIAALSETAPEDAQDFVQRYGLPPDPFHQVSSDQPSVELPLVDREGALYEALTTRRTIRAFDTSKPLPSADLATLLRYTFGCHGTNSLSPDTLLVHKTSPSGGSLHPIEAYPLVIHVESVASGLYHYDVHDHSLTPLQSLGRSAASELAVELANGQLYAQSAHVLVLMTVRFFRNQWKYRRRSRTYGVMLMDAGHLSQTFYLVATELGLGAFYTAAVNGTRIEQTIGLEPQEEGALAICGCGIRRSDGEDLGLKFEPFVPRTTYRRRH